jgi:peptidoglycan hydrolase-like protein with peptidoglycan-binding domain
VARLLEAACGVSVIRPSVRASTPPWLAPRLADPGARLPRPAADRFDGPTAPASARLQRGAVGPAVRALQDRLVRVGALTASDVASGPGVFGPRTEAGVRRFQARVGLPSTGIATPETLQALRSDGFIRAARAPRRETDEATTQPTSRAAVDARLADTFTDEDPDAMGASPGLV